MVIETNILLINSADEMTLVRRPIWKSNKSKNNNIDIISRQDHKQLIN